MTAPSPAPARTGIRPGFIFRAPPWMVWAGNIAGVAALLVGTNLALQIRHRLRTRVVVTPMPTLAQLADSVRRHAPASPAARRAAPVPALGGTTPVAALAAARPALVAGRWDDAAAALARDTASGSAALGLSLVAAWQGDEGTARAAVARARRQVAGLSPDERTWLEAHERWMAGDIHGADSSYRVLVGRVPDDPTAWYAAAYVQRHDGGAIDSALVAPGSPTSRGMRRLPERRISHGGAIPALWRVLQLSPWHEAARVDLAAFASYYRDHALLQRLAWGGELAPVTPATRLALRVLSADAQPDSADWQVARRVAATATPDAVFAAARRLATSAGLARPTALARAAELLGPLTDATRHPADVVALAHAWQGQLWLSLQWPAAARRAFHAAAALDSALGLPLAAEAAWLVVGTPDSVLAAERVAVAAWSGASVGTPGDPRHPHAGMGPPLRAWALGLLDAARHDTAGVRRAAEALERMAPLPRDAALGTDLAAGLRAELALARLDFAAAIAATDRMAPLLAPLDRDASPVRGRMLARYRRAYAQQQAWRNDPARAAYVAFLSPTFPELALYRSVRTRFDATP